MQQGATQCQKTFVKPVGALAGGVVGNVGEQARSEVIPAPTVAEQDGSDVPPAAASDTTKLRLAQAYVTAHDDWWRSLVTPPFNEKKGAGHEALAIASHKAFVAFGSGIQAARMMCVL